MILNYQMIPDAFDKLDVPGGAIRQMPHGFQEHAARGTRERCDQADEIYQILRQP